MRTFSFTLRIEHSFSAMEHVDAVYSRCGDATVEAEGEDTLVHFDRGAGSLDEALRSAVADMSALGHNIAAIEVEPACVGAQ